MLDMCVCVVCERRAAPAGSRRVLQWWSDNVRERQKYDTMLPCFCIKWWTPAGKTHLSHMPWLVSMLSALQCVCMSVCLFIKNPLCIRSGGDSILHVIDFVSLSRPYIVVQCKKWIGHASAEQQGSVSIMTSKRVQWIYHNRRLFIVLPIIFNRNKDIVLPTVNVSIWEPNSYKVWQRVKSIN